LSWRDVQKLLSRAISWLSLVPALASHAVVCLSTSLAIVGALVTFLVQWIGKERWAASSLASLIR
jgi:2-methylaconitate cis-trans-isomerase PrpF